MEIKYTFANGEETTVEVCGGFEEIILELDRNLYNNNHAETRRHISLNVFNEDKKVFTDIEAGFEKQLSDQVDMEILYKAISRLRPDERDLINKFYLNDEPMTQKQYANILGVTENAIQLRLAKAKKKLRRIITENK